MRRTCLPALSTSSLCLALLAPAAGAVPVPATDLDTLAVGGTIVGPVGPEVEVSLASGDAVFGDLRSSVACPPGLDPCVPPQNPPGTIYTYRHSVTPGVDAPNDPPFPAPPGDVQPLAGAFAFALGFSATGFNGVAGYSFAEADAALGDDGVFAIDFGADGALSWSLSNPGGWETGESITFFWQTSQPPSGPGGTYRLSGTSITASGAGPLPVPVVTVAASFPPLGLGLLLLAVVSRRRPRARAAQPVVLLLSPRTRASRTAI